MNNIVNKLKFFFLKNVIEYLDTELSHFADILIKQYLNDLFLSFVQLILSYKRM